MKSDDQINVLTQDGRLYALRCLLEPSGTVTNHTTRITNAVTRLVLILDNFIWNFPMSIAHINLKKIKNSSPLH